MAVFHALVEAAGVDPAARPALRDRVDAKDASGVAAALAGTPPPPRWRTRWSPSRPWPGGVSILDRAAQAVHAVPAAAAAVAELRALVDALVAAGLGGASPIDLGDVRAFDYYTGLVFRIFAPGLGFEVGSGGRYDGLLARFGRPLPAIGFMLGLDRVALLLERQGAIAPSGAAPAEPVASLAEACQKRRAGARVRLAPGKGAR